MNLPRPCIDCGELVASGSRCETHRREHDAAHRRPARAERERRMYGSGTGHRRRSLRLRRAQPFCTDCGSTDDLTLDHLPSSLDRLDAGMQPLDSDHEVVCRSCNDRRGPARDRASRTGR